MTDLDIKEKRIVDKMDDISKRYPRNKPGSYDRLLFALSVTELQLIETRNELHGVEPL